MRRSLVTGVACVFVGAAACSTTGSAAPAPRPIASAPSATTASKVVVTGVARDVKGGAAIVGDDGKVTRIEGLDQWPKDVAGRRVIAAGVLEKRTGPACVNDPLPCQGIGGDYWVLAGASYRLE